MVSVEMYTTAICPYCVAAKNLLKQKGFDYSEIRVDTDPERREEMLALMLAGLMTWLRRIAVEGSQKLRRRPMPD